MRKEEINAGRSEGRQKLQSAKMIDTGWKDLVRDWSMSGPVLG